MTQPRSEGHPAPPYLERWHQAPLPKEFLAAATLHTKLLHARPKRTFRACARFRETVCTLRMEPTFGADSTRGFEFRNQPVDRLCAVPAIWATVRADRPVLAFAVRSSPTGADRAGVQASLRCRYVGCGRALLAVLAGNDVRAHGREIESGARVRVRVAD